jgi:hypothetical protein
MSLSSGRALAPLNLNFAHVVAAIASSNWRTSTGGWAMHASVLVVYRIETGPDWAKRDTPYPEFYTLNAMPIIPIMSIAMKEGATDSD